MDELASLLAPTASEQEHEDQALPPVGEMAILDTLMKPEVMNSVAEEDMPKKKKAKKDKINQLCQGYGFPNKHISDVVQGDEPEDKQRRKLISTIEALWEAFPEHREKINPNAAFELQLPRLKDRVREMESLCGGDDLGKDFSVLSFAIILAAGQVEQFLPQKMKGLTAAWSATCEQMKNKLRVIEAKYAAVGGYVPIEAQVGLGLSLSAFHVWKVNAAPPIPRAPSDSTASTTVSAPTATLLVQQPQ
jgi:hypothetical protein